MLLWWWRPCTHWSRAEVRQSTLPHAPTPPPCPSPLPSGARARTASARDSAGQKSRWPPGSRGCPASSPLPTGAAPPFPLLLWLLLSLSRVLMTRTCHSPPQTHHHHPQRGRQGWAAVHEDPETDGPWPRFPLHGADAQWDSRAFVAPSVLCLCSHHHDHHRCCRHSHCLPPPGSGQKRTDNALEREVPCLCLWQYPVVVREHQHWPWVKRPRPPCAKRAPLLRDCRLQAQPRLRSPLCLGQQRWWWWWRRRCACPCSSCCLRKG